MVNVSPEKVPMMSAAHAQSVSLVMSKDATISELAAVIETDPAMTLGMLRVANSAAESPVDRVSRVGDAMVRIGLEDTRRIVLAVVLQGSAANEELAKSGLDIDEMWRHVVATAILSDGVAMVDEALRPSRQFAFSAGLLHDVGRLVMASGSPAHYQRVLRRIANGADVREAERSEFGDDHATFGAVVAREWGLAEEVVTAIASHHEAASGVGSAIRRARTLAWKLGIGDGLAAAPAATLGGDDEDALAVMHLGGSRQVLTKIDWFRSAIAYAER